MFYLRQRKQLCVGFMQWSLFLFFVLPWCWHDFPDTKNSCVCCCCFYKEVSNCYTEVVIFHLRQRKQFSYTVVSFHLDVTVFHPSLIKYTCMSRKTSFTWTSSCFTQVQNTLLQPFCQQVPVLHATFIQAEPRKQAFIWKMVLCSTAF